MSSAGIPPHPAEILVLKPSSLGDVVHTLPAVALVKRHWPDAHLRWLINPEWAPLLENNPYVDEVILFPRREFRGLRGALRIAPWARQIREQHPSDLILDFQGLLRSALIARLCRAPDGRIVGLSDAREGARFFYDRTVDVSRHTHAVERYLALVSALGIPVPGELEWPLPEGSRVAIPDGGYILLHPFSRGAGKSLSVEDVVTFCKALAPLRVVIAGRSDHTLPVIPNAHNLLNQTSISELIWLVRNARGVVSVDSGPMHIAAALTDRLVSIHTWSDPHKVGPYRPGAWVWKAGTLQQMAAYMGEEPGLPSQFPSDYAALAQAVATLW